MPDEKALAALSLVYDAATDSERWRPALDAIASVIGADCAALMVHEQIHSTYNILALSSAYLPMIESGDVHYYLEHLRPLELNDWRALEQSRVREPRLDIETFSNAAELDARADYVFLRERMGLRRRGGVRLNDNKAWFDALTFGFNRPLKAGPAAAFKTLALLLPHMAKAAEMGRTFTRLRARYKAVIAALDRVRVGLCIALPSGEIIVTNSEADRILSLGDGLTLSRDNRLLCRQPEQTRMLQHCLSKAARTAAGRSTLAERLIPISRPSSGHPLLVEVAPIRDSARELDFDLDGAIVTLIDPENVPYLEVGRFSHLYGLTAAESDVCELMVKGFTAGAIAEMRGTSPETAKSQGRAVLQKTGTSSRLELIRLVLRLLPPIG